MGTVLNPFGVIIIGPSLDQSHGKQKGRTTYTIQNGKSREKEKKAFPAKFDFRESLASQHPEGTLMQARHQ